MRGNVRELCIWRVPGVHCVLTFLYRQDPLPIFRCPDGATALSGSSPDHPDLITSSAGSARWKCHPSAEARAAGGAASVGAARGSMAGIAQNTAVVTELLLDLKRAFALSVPPYGVRSPRHKKAPCGTPHPDPSSCAGRQRECAT